MNKAVQVAKEERKAVWEAMLDLTVKYGFFSRKQLALAVSLDETIVGYWLQHFINGEDVIVETAGTYHVDKEYIG
jgi:hypothetical protein